jgi:hypothetical protein
MTKPRTLETSDPKAHAANIEQMLTEVIERLERYRASRRTQIASAFEISAEVLIGLRTAYQHYQSGSERAMRSGR